MTYLYQLKKPDFRPACECCNNSSGTERIVIMWEEWWSLKSHYPKYKIMRASCEGYEGDNYTIIESSKNWKVVKYG